MTCKPTRSMTWQRTKATVVDSALTQRTSYSRWCRLLLNVLASSRAGATLVIYKLGRSGTTLSRLFHVVLGLGTAVDAPALQFTTASTLCRNRSDYIELSNPHSIAAAAQSRIFQISHFQPKHSLFSPDRAKYTEGAHRIIEKLFPHRANSWDPTSKADT